MEPTQLEVNDEQLRPCFAQLIPSDRFRHDISSTQIREAMLARAKTGTAEPQPTQSASPAAATTHKGSDQRV
jgi:hypothetical protein